MAEGKKIPGVKADFLRFTPGWRAPFPNLLDLEKAQINNYSKGESERLPFFKTFLIYAYSMSSSDLATSLEST